MDRRYACLERWRTVRSTINNLQRFYCGQFVANVRARLCRTPRKRALFCICPISVFSEGLLVSAESDLRVFGRCSQRGGREFEPPAVHQPSLWFLTKVVHRSGGASEGGPPRFPMSYGWQAQNSRVDLRVLRSLTTRRQRLRRRVPCLCPNDPDSRPRSFALRWDALARQHPRGRVARDGITM